MPEILPIIISADYLHKASSYFVPHPQSLSLPGNRQGEGGRATEYDSTKLQHIICCLFTHLQ